MQRIKIEDEEYYVIRKGRFWRGILVALALTAMVILCISCLIHASANEEDAKECYKTEYGKLESKLENTGECFLCGNHQRSLVPYYRKQGGIGVIELNEWNVLGFHLKVFDENGNEIDKSGTMSFIGGTENGITYHVDAVPSRGMSSMTLSNEKGFSSETVVNHLCQVCLDKVTDTLEAYQYEGEEEIYYPFVLVDFETRELHSLQRWHTGVSLGYYWVEIEYLEEGDIEIGAYYLPERNISSSSQ